MKNEMKVLIVDDDCNFCKTLAKVLMKKNFIVETCHDGIQAQEIIMTDSFDVVLMDIKMPLLNGVETYKRIKLFRPNLTVILMTAFSVDDLIKEAVSSGVYAVLRKPIDIEATILMLEKTRKGGFVAVVDDDQMTCTTMKKVFEKRGYAVTSCFTGEEAVFLSKQHRMGTFFIDVKLPVCNGLETLKKIKKANPNFSLVMMTAYRNEVKNIVKEAIRCGAHSCLYKPFDIDKALMIAEELSTATS